MIFIDSNIFMYAAGENHAFKKPSVEFLEQVARAEIDACISTEILQEILHRYRSINRWSDANQVYTLAKAIAPNIELITVDILDRATEILDRYPGLMARDGVHAATCFCLALDGICSYDRDFDTVEGLVRLTP